MPDYLFLMHEVSDASDGARTGDWGSYIAKLNASGHFQRGSAIGPGVCARKTGAAAAITAHLSDYIRVAAADLDEAQGLLAGNPVFEAGGTVEIRELPPTD
jgi:hypothetical protein